MLESTSLWGLYGIPFIMLARKEIVIEFFCTGKLCFQYNATKYYKKEAILLLIQSQKFSDQMKGQLLLVARSINMRGRAGCNILCDLHMEHLN